MEDMAEKKKRETDSHAQQYGSSDGDSTFWKMDTMPDKDFDA
jgi:hypothetical protein